MFVCTIQMAICRPPVWDFGLPNGVGITYFMNRTTYRGIRYVHEVRIIVNTPLYRGKQLILNHRKKFDLSSPKRYWSKKAINETH